ncbi:MAG: hypothetical protein R2710_19415 [Acidimicrobiales bacterium]
MGLIGLVVGGMVISLYLPMFRIIDFVSRSSRLHLRGRSAEDEFS